MNDEVLRIQAVVVDKSTGPLRQIAAAMKVVGKDGVSKDMTSGFANLRKELHPLVKELDSNLMPVLTAFGITTAGVGASLAGVTTWMNSVAKSSVGLGYMARELNFSRKALLEWQAVGKDLQIEQPLQGLQKFSDMLFNIRNETTAGKEALLWMEKSGVPNLASAMYKAAKEDDYPKALDLVQKALDRLPDYEKRAYLAQYMFGSRDYARMAMNKYYETLKNHGPLLDADIEAMERWEKASNSLLASWERLKTTVGNAIAPWMTKQIEHLNLSLKSQEEISKLTDEEMVRRALNSHEPGYVEEPLDPIFKYELDDREIRKKRQNIKPAQPLPWLERMIDQTKKGPDPKDVEDAGKEWWKKFIPSFIKSGYDAAEGFGGFGAQRGGFMNATYTVGGGFSNGGGGQHAVGGGNFSQPAGPLGKDTALFGTRKENAQRIYDSLRALGHTHEQASAALGHIKAESNFNPSVVGDSGTAFGFFQHRGSRWANALALSKKLGLNPYSPEAAARFFDWELHNTESAAGKRYFNSSSTKDAVTALNGYERFRGWQYGQMERYRAGEGFAKSMSQTPALDGSLSKQTGINANGSANINVEFTGAPKGTRVGATSDGLFKEPTIVQHSPQMQWADDYSDVYN